MQGKTRTDLANLRALSTSAPRTKSGRIMWAWPQIQASLNSGRKMHEIWEALQLDGVEMSYGQFRTYVWRIRKRLTENADRTQSSPAIVPPPTRDTRHSVVQDPGVSVAGPARDPLANIRREQERKRKSGFTYDPVPDDGK